MQVLALLPPLALLFSADASLLEPEVLCLRWDSTDWIEHAVLSLRHSGFDVPATIKGRSAIAVGESELLVGMSDKSLVLYYHHGLQVKAALPVSASPEIPAQAEAPAPQTNTPISPMPTGTPSTLIPTALPTQLPSEVVVKPATAAEPAASPTAPPSPQTCRDLHAQCEAFSQAGECAANPIWMMASTP